jgi:hypothetical protein
LVLLPPEVTKPDAICLFVELCEGYHAGVSMAREMERRITKAMASVTMDTYRGLGRNAVLNYCLLYDS